MTVDRVPWHSWLQSLDWQQGQHATLIGPTGAGKTTAALALLAERERRRGSIVVAGTKPRDQTLNRLRGKRGRGYRLRRDWPPGAHEQRVLLWPRLRGRSDQPRQADTLGRMLDDVFAQGSWTLYVDELLYAVNKLHLEPHLSLIWEQGRAMGVTLITTTQRPRHVPVVTYSASSLVLLWRTSEEQDQRRLAEIGGGLSSRSIAREVADLERHEILAIDTRTGSMARTFAPSK